MSEGRISLSNRHQSLFKFDPCEAPLSGPRIVVLLIFSEYLHLSTYQVQISLILYQLIFDFFKTSCFIPGSRMDSFTSFQNPGVSHPRDLLPAADVPKIEDRPQDFTQIQPFPSRHPSAGSLPDGLPRSTSTLSRENDEYSQTTQRQESPTPERLKSKLLYAIVSI